MAHIILTAEQLQVLESATSAVEVRDEAGRVVARIPSPSEQEILERIERNRTSNVARFPADQVEQRLQRLDEIRRQRAILVHRLDQVRAESHLGSQATG
jgi:hypothetical protein